MTQDLLPWAPQYWAEVWWCGDDHCDCHQPQITLATPNLYVKARWGSEMFRLTEVWRGTFICEPSGKQLMALGTELEEECRKRGIALGRSLATDVDAEQVAAIDKAALADSAAVLGGPLPEVNDKMSLYEQAQTIRRIGGLGG